MDSHPTVPASEADVTAEWLQNALVRAFPGMAYETIEGERIGEAYGLASQIFRYRWQAGRTQHSVVIKLWSTDSPAGIREVLFYRKFGEAAGVRVPACFHAAFDLDKKRGVLILEDLRAVVQGDCLQQLSFEQAKTVAFSLAGMHATWLQNDALRQAEWLPSVSKWERDSQWFETRRTVFLERFGNQLDGFARSLLNHMEQAAKIANDRMAGAPVTLLHAELQLDNFVFERGTEPVILDWASCAKGPFTLDLAELLFEMSKLEDLEQVLAAYLTAFTELSAKELDFHTVRSQLGGALLRKFARATCGVARWLPDSPREAALINVGIQRAIQSVRYWSTQDTALFSFLR